ncbi:Prephenate dehydrogenase [Fistulina hepatica ATCC 64428]|uniref:Prephenate dehydrogenase [NADP(+)] n=1 Tax=Fistulina hepatica ATCC 64428 TaxID=1128425 RepID=A0A0D7A1B6_9AGAR|nr:Prephenate dehydrogenase [Fistulina hepatica ATCC 64428]
MSAITACHRFASISPQSPLDEQPTIGLIGMGAMGKMYAKYLSEAGWKKIHVCDLPEKFDELNRMYENAPGIIPMRDGHAVSRSSDFIMYIVEAKFIDRVVAQYGPSTKQNAIVAGQTSVKAPERAAFEKHLPSDVAIVSCHSLHGPSVSPEGQPLILIKHRASDDDLFVVECILRPLRSRYVYLSYEDHDHVTANTQAVIHAAFLSMGTAWAQARSYPWEQGLYVGGIETAKVNIMLRIYSNKWHVYAGLAILNPEARVQIGQYAQSASALFKMMLQGGAGEAAFRMRVQWARETVFGKGASTANRTPILLSQQLLDRFSLGTPPASGQYKANSHLSLLAMVDCWAHLGIQPFDHLAVAATPLFRLFLGVAEHLFLNQALLDSAIHSAMYDTWHRSDDLEFVVAARGWSQCVSFGNFDLYQRRFEETREFFEERFAEGTALGSQMIQAIMETEIKRESELHSPTG